MNTKMHSEWVMKKNLKYVFLGTFFYAIFISVVVQFVLLPFVFPSLHYGYGLLKHHDWIAYHLVAAEMVEKMHVNGWSQWELRPFGWIEPGLISLVYYFTVSKPWALIPFNAFFHAAAVLVIVLLLQAIIPLTRKSFYLAVVPFALFPTALLWMTQIHKDGIAFFACFFFIYSLVRLSAPFWNAEAKTSVGIGTLCLLVSSALGWLVRPYLGDVYSLELFLLSLLVTVRVLFKFKKFLREKEKIFLLLWLWLLTFMLRPLLDLGTYKHVAPLAPPPKILIESGERGFDLPIEQVEKTIPEDLDWANTPFVPTVVENKLFAVAQIRNGYGKTEGSTNIDSKVRFRRVFDFVFYLPRALQIAFLLPSPFPSAFWSGAIGNESNLQKKLVRIEMVGVYMFLPFVFFQIYRYRRRFEILLLVGSCTLFMLVYTYTVSNLGTLHRFRYGFVTLLLGLGIPAFVEGLEKLYVIFFQQKNTRAIESPAS